VTSQLNHEGARLKDDNHKLSATWTLFSRECSVSLLCLLVCDDLRESTRAQTNSFVTSPLRLLNAIHVLLAANKDLAISNGRRRIYWFPDRVSAKDFVFGSGLDDECVSVLTGEQNLSFESNWRGSKGSGNWQATAFVFNFTRLCVETRQNAAIGR
jgi:hypothetical protein